MTRFSAAWYDARTAADRARREQAIDAAQAIVESAPFRHFGIGNCEPVILTRDGPLTPRPPPASPSRGPSVVAGGAATPKEAAILKAVIKALALHPRVAWAHRMNVGAFKDGDRYVRVGFRGCSDIIGQMRDGRFLAVECKRPGGRATDDQLAFLARVEKAGGVAFIAWGVDDVTRELARG